MPRGLAFRAVHMKPTAGSRDKCRPPVVPTLSHAVSGASHNHARASKHAVQGAAQACGRSQGGRVRLWFLASAIGARSPVEKSPAPAK